MPIPQGLKTVNKNDIDSEFNTIKTELNLIKWIAGIILAGVISIVTKTYLP